MIECPLEVSSRGTQPALLLCQLLRMDRCCAAAEAALSLLEDVCFVTCVCAWVPSPGVYHTHVLGLCANMRSANVHSSEMGAIHKVQRPCAL